MRKILLASTALVALTSVSAMAADISISGSTNFTYLNDTAGSPTDESSFGVESDIAISFSATTDSGISTTMTYGFDDADGAADDANATMSGDFGSIMIVNSALDGNYVSGMDETFDTVAEGSQEATTLGGVAGDSIGYKFPTLVDGMMIAVQHANEDGSESFGYGVSYDAGMAKVSMAKIANNTEEHSSVSLTTTVAGISLAIEQNKTEVTEGTVDEDETTAYGASYAMDGITLSYEAGSTKDEDGSSQGDYAQFAVTYAIAPGIAAVFTSSEVNDEDGSGADDVESTDLQLQLSF
jgi:hypothetical protein